MIIETKRGNNILAGNETRIAFAVNTEGINDSGFAGKIAYAYWPELANIGPCKLGTVLSKECDGVTFYALVCHSLKDGWKNQSEIIRQCFDKIECDAPVASISIGTGLIGILSGANFAEIQAGMEASKAKIILY
ncbi:MAG: hypothetical protein IJO08_04350 [Clostridia bacterium]|nr:hypothetical protein [Clostridia bacterium]